MNTHNFNTRDFAYGNYFEVKLECGETRILQCISADKQNKETTFDEWGVFKWSDIKPIEITPERLKTIGFKSDSRKNGMWSKMGIDLIPRIKTKSWHIAGVRGANVKYFHELQNIAFAIKTKELKLNFE